MVTALVTSCISSPLQNVATAPAYPDTAKELQPRIKIPSDADDDLSHDNDYFVDELDDDDDEYDECGEGSAERDEGMNVGGTVASESALRSSRTLLSQARASQQAPWPYGGFESPRSPCWDLAIYKNETYAFCSSLAHRPLVVPG
ncbi:hypothetical protein PoB_005689300 [Plakobranchus ocellatus]|uniref:Secreted protein n=1 Tax=Plakobranchus ocellatus TaxID=259542 RepID=A0AAV4CH68_9GAST|nr:hypothetical protein PoB_005689300 [Plakobranchus ocellatus]